MTQPDSTTVIMMELGFALVSIMVVGMIFAIGTFNMFKNSEVKNESSDPCRKNWERS